MSKKNRRNHQDASEPVTETALAVMDAPVTETVDAPVTETVDATPDAAPATPAKTYVVNPDRAFKPRRGFETVLYSALTTPRTEAELIAHLLDSGEFARVAPQAAALRPAKPTRYLLKVWAQGHVLTVS